VKTKDKRPDPKPRKHPQLWQSYLWWDELVQMRKRHTLRISSIEAGKSNLDAQFERDMMEGHAKVTHISRGKTTETTIGVPLDAAIAGTKEIMIGYGKDVGPVWDWLASIKGLGAGGLAAQLLAQFDDVSKFDTVSKFWRFAGQAVYFYWRNGQGTIAAPRDGYKSRKAKKGERAMNGTICGPGMGKLVEPGMVVREYIVPTPEPDWKLVKHRDIKLSGWNSPYNARLKSICYLIVEQFIKQQTPVYVDIYYAEKERQRHDHPEPIKENGKWKFNDGHLHHRAMRKTAKIFLQHLWVKWREAEGLPVSKPYVEAVLGHTNII